MKQNSETFRGCVILPQIICDPFASFVSQVNSGAVLLENLQIDILHKFFFQLYPILDSIVVSIPACHAGDRGSIPRRGDFFARSKIYVLFPNH